MRGDKFLSIGERISLDLTQILVSSVEVAGLVVEDEVCASPNLAANLQSALHALFMLNLGGLGALSGWWAIRIKHWPFLLPAL